jgi:putative transposase
MTHKRMEAKEINLSISAAGKDSAFIVSYALKNAINLAFFMVNLSHILINTVRPQNAEFSVQDLKAYFRGSKYVEEILKLLPEKLDPILIQQIFKELGVIGGINAD